MVKNILKNIVKYMAIGLGLLLLIPIGLYLAILSFVLIVLALKISICCIPLLVIFGCPSYAAYKILKSDC